MKKIVRSLVLLLLVGTFAFLGFGQANADVAPVVDATLSLSASPTSSSVGGSNFTVTATLNPGSNTTIDTGGTEFGGINTVQLDVTFDPNVVHFVSTTVLNPFTLVSQTTVTNANNTGNFQLVVMASPVVFATTDVATLVFSPNGSGNNSAIDLANTSDAAFSGTGANLVATRTGTTVSVAAGSDVTAPVVTAFTLPATNPSLTIPISSFTATDDTGVTAWMIKQTTTNSAPVAPVSGDSGWQTSNISGTTSATITGNLTAQTTGTRYYWAYAKDAAGNVSAPSTVQVVNVPTYSLGGVVSGLTGTVSLRDSISGLTSNVSSIGQQVYLTGDFFSGDDYDFNVVTQPTNQICTIANGSGTIAGADITDINVTCVDVPAILSIVRHSPTQQSTNSASVTFRITFNMPVQNVTTDDFVMLGTAASAIAQAPGGSGSSVTQISSSIYDFTITRTFEGTFYLSPTSPDLDIQDLDGNPFTGQPGTIGTVEQYSFHGPVVTLTSAANLPKDTTQTTVTFSTDVQAICQYATISGQAYGQGGATIISPAGTTHSFDVTGLTNGSSYGYFIRCKDSNDMFNLTDQLISFSVGAADIVPAKVEEEGDSSEKDKEKEVKPHSVFNSEKNIKRGRILVQKGKRFSKNTIVELYFGKPGGGYYAPLKVKTSASGTFKVTYRVTKPRGQYGWYALDTKTGRKSKITYYKVR